MMKVLLAISVLFVCTAVQAVHLEYFGCRKWIEQQCATNTTPQDRRLFVGRMVSPELDEFRNLWEWLPGRSGPAGWFLDTYTDMSEVFVGALVSRAEDCIPNECKKKTGGK